MTFIGKFFKTITRIWFLLIVLFAVSSLYYAKTLYTDTLKKAQEQQQTQQSETADE